jgi:hypothetical protein
MTRRRYVCRVAAAYGRFPGRQARSLPFKRAAEVHLGWSGSIPTRWGEYARRGGALNKAPSRTYGLVAPGTKDSGAQDLLSVGIDHNLHESLHLAFLNRASYVRQVLQNCWAIAAGMFLCSAEGRFSVPA